MGETEPDAILSWLHSKSVMEFSISSKGLTKNNDISVAEVTFPFFYKNYSAGFEADKRSDSWKEDMDEPERTRLKNLFGATKRTVRIVLMHTDSFSINPDDPTKIVPKETFWHCNDGRGMHPWRSRFWKENYQHPHTDEPSND